MKRRALALVTAALAILPAAVRADTPPSVWQRARDAKATEEFDLHRAAQQRLVRTNIVGIDFGERERVRVMLERAIAEGSTNPLLKFDLGEVYSLLENHRRAAQVLKAALAEFPDHPAADRAWHRLSDACGRLGDHACEQEAYVHVLQRETEDIARMTPTLNLAETHMHNGELKEAIEGYREAFRLATRVSEGMTAALAMWGLAVALDRESDRIGAERAARDAESYSKDFPNLLRSEHVFFVPDYEIHWYEGLGAVALARGEPSARAALVHWMRAEQSFGAYVKGAERSNDRWLPIAKARLAQVKADRERAEKLARREPAPERGGDLNL